MQSFFRTSALALVTLCVTAAPALSQSFPDRPIKVVVPFPAGTTTDIVARIVGAGTGAAGHGAGQCAGRYAAHQAAQS